MNKFNQLAKEVGENLDRYELGVASQKIYDFIWDVYCDWYIELTKPRIAAGGETALTAQHVLVWVMKGMLKLLHPFMPYITEEIWQVLTDDGSVIMVQPFPVYDESLDFTKDEADFEKVVAAISAIRNVRGEMNVPPSVKAKLFIETAERDAFEKGFMFFERLASASEISFVENFDGKDCATAVTDCARMFIPLSEIIDTEKELARLNKEKKAAQKDIDFLEGKLSNQGFLAKAPEKLINEQKEKLAKAKEKMEKIEQSLASLRSAN